MREVDNTIKIIANSAYYSPYIEDFVNIVKDNVDIYGIHFGGGLNIKGSENEDENDIR